MRASIGRLQDAMTVVGPLAKATRLEDARVQRLWREVQAALDAPEPIELLVVPDDRINGMAHGLRTPRVALTRGAVTQLDAGRWWLGGTGINLVLTVPILLALYEWDRKSELSADRAEVLVTGRPDVSVRLFRLCADPPISRAEVEARAAALGEGAERLTQGGGAALDWLVSKSGGGRSD